MQTPISRNDGSSTSAGYTSPCHPVFVGDMEVISPPEQERKSEKSEEVLVPLKSASDSIPTQTKQKHVPPLPRNPAVKPGGALNNGKAPVPYRPKTSRKQQAGGVSKSHSDTRPDQKGRRCHVCKSPDHIKSQCPVRQNENKSRKQSFVYQSLLDENQRLKGDNDALKELRAQDLAVEPVEVVEAVPAPPYESQNNRLNGKTWEYSIELDEVSLIQKRSVEIVWAFVEAALTINFTLTFWVKFYTLYILSVLAMWAASVASIRVLTWAEVYTENEEGELVRDFAGRSLLERFREAVAITNDDMVANFEERVSKYRSGFSWLYQFLTGGRKGLSLAVFLAQPLSLLFMFWGTFIAALTVLPVIEIFLICCIFAPFYVIGFMFWLWYNYKRFFKVKHTYKTKSTRIMDFIDRRPVSIAICDVEHPRVVGRVKHKAVVELDLGFFGCYEYCEVVKEEILPNMELMVQMVSAGNLFFPDDTTALNFFKKQPARIANINTNRVDDVKDVQTAQTSLLAFAVYKDFKRKSTLSGLPY